jgi:hypothetical protein
MNAGGPSKKCKVHVEHWTEREDERCAADAPLTRLREAPGTKCARGQSADSDLDKQSETPKECGFFCMKLFWKTPEPPVWRDWHLLVRS